MINLIQFWGVFTNVAYLNRLMIIESEEMITSLHFAISVLP
jgi:hypothetical protein